jgi:hypothetical protein
LSPEDRTIIIEETNADRKLCSKVNDLIASGRLDVVVASAKAAIANELTPGVNRDTAGQWPLLRARVRGLLNSVPSAIAERVRRMTTGEKMDVVRAVLNRGGTTQLLGLGDAASDAATATADWGITSSLISSIAGIAGSLYTTKVTVDAQKDITQMQSSAAMQNAQAQIALANAQAAISAAQRVQSPLTAVRTAMTASVGGVPVMAIAVPGIALILYMIFKGKRR